uniref:Uncharacterized protein n=1 Tax=Knipowitschia caucasica TaxID=637954 RepID=A0AAV2LPN9_KNICA
MERRVKWLSHLVALVCLLQATTADLTCRSCHSGHLWRLKELTTVRFGDVGEVLARSGERSAEEVHKPLELSGEVAGLKVSAGNVGESDGTGGRRVRRADLRWSGEERRGAAAQRQDELKLNSSTFALSGDSSHNQAMVHWSGQNSSQEEIPDEQDESPDEQEEIPDEQTEIPDEQKEIPD